MKRKIELLAPGGDITAMKTAIYAGADAIYCGLNKFNARNRATNISFEDLQGILRIAHQHDCAVFLTLNIVILESEVPALIKLLNRLVNTSIDGVIVQDLGLMHILNSHFPTLEIHASTQLNTHNEGQIKFLKSLNAKRVNLSRELSIEEIKDLSSVAHQHEMGIEVFVHGSYCISFSGQCYMSSLQSGNSGNRGQCSQPCREQFHKTSAGVDYPLNLKDNSAFRNLEELYEAGVDSLKIEGRIKEFEYVYTVVNAWRKQIDKYSKGITLSIDDSDLYKVFNRDFSNGFLKKNIAKEMFIDNPMNHSIAYLNEKNKGASIQVRKQKQDALLAEKENLRTALTEVIGGYKIAKLPLSITISGTSNSPLCITIKTPDAIFEMTSESTLSNSGTEALTESIVNKRLRAIEETEYFIETIEYNITDEVYLPFRELTQVKKRLLFILNGNKKFQAPVMVPSLNRHKKSNHKPELSMIISSLDDLDGIENYDGAIFYKLPNRLDDIAIFEKLFSENKQLHPYFPAVLIDNDYSTAVELLDRIKPKVIVTDNTGIGFQAKQREITWIAGPQMNLTNSYSLLALKETFNCSGAFLSNELSKQQLLGIKPPENFNLYYIIYQPIMLMNSRQCFFHQVDGCKKHLIDNSCISHCERSARISNLKDEVFIVEKSKGNYHRIYSTNDLLNTEISNDIGDRFASLAIDFSQINKYTNIKKSTLLTFFKEHLSGDDRATLSLSNRLTTTNNIAYYKGI